jgi:VanZ family protein
MLRSSLASPRLWLFSVILWGGALFLLSSLPTVPHVDGPEIPHLDKVMHFGYFMGGAFLFTNYLLLRHGVKTRPLVRVFAPILLFSVIGALDEYHQTFTPGRSGNDPFDWLADLLGAVSGTFLAHIFHPLILKISSSVPHSCKNCVH